MPALAVILNPVARHGWAGRHRRDLERALRAAGLAYDLHLTRAPGHAVELAAGLADAHAVVVAAGGDGTVNEVSRGLLCAGGHAALGLVPFGTGNDFAKMVGVPCHVRRAVEVLGTGCPRRVDYGRLRWWERGEQPAGEGLFVNAAGMGFDGQVAVAVDRFRGLPGPAAYVAAVFQSLARWRSPDGRVVADGREVHRGDFLLVTASNGACSGGGFYLAPGASVTDGHLDLLVVEHVTAGRAVRLVPGVLRGQHVREPEVSLHPARRIEVSAATPVPLHADGEVVTRAARRLEVEVVPAGLRVLAPCIRETNAAPETHNA